jgi:hypothetical protein
MSGQARYLEGTIQGDTPVQPVGGKWGLIVLVDATSKKVTVATAGTGQGILVDGGKLTEAGAAIAGQPCVVCVDGDPGLPVQCNEAIGLGVNFTSRGTDGRAKPAGAADLIVGRTTTPTGGASGALRANAVIGHSGFPQSGAAP